MSTVSRGKKNAITVLLSMVLLFPGLAAASFTDVPVSHPDYDAITQLQKNNIISGYTDGTFKPDQLVTRAELLKLVFKDVGYMPPQKTFDTKFKDVPPSSWFAPYVKKAMDLGVISINPDIPLFYPAEPVSKIDALKIIMPIEGIPAPFVNDNSKLIFDDISPSASYSYLVRAAQNAGLYTIEDGHIFHPFDLLTRAKTAELLYRAELYRETGPGSSYMISSDLSNYFSDTEAQLIDNPKFPVLLDVWTKINQEYIDHANLNKNDLVYGAIEGMVNTLNDPYSIFENPDQAKAIQNELEGTFEGIGTVLDTIDNNYIVVNVLKDSPADKAGVKAGDIITKVDGQDLSSLKIEDVIGLIQGPAGSQVKVTVKRDTQVLTFTITRAELTMDTVLLNDTYNVTIPSDIGYISIYQFTSSTNDEFDKIFKETMDKKPIGLILDLRDNPGGYLDAAYSILGHFFKNGKIIMNLKIDGKIQPQESQGRGEFSDVAIPLIVMVNSGSASAAEVTAGALQDYKLGRLLGEQTYGKGTVQEVTDYTDGSFFKLSIAHWLTPLEHDINKVGLTPDIIVKRTKDDILNNGDSQLERAILELQK